MILIQHCTICCDAVSVKKCSDTSVRSPVTWMTPPRSSNKISCTLTFPANPGLSVGGTTLGGELTSTSDSIRSCQLRYQNRHISSIWTYWFFFFFFLNTIGHCNCRVDFENFRLAPPNPTSTVCEDDYFSVTGSLTPTPKLCGDSYNDQHSNVLLNINYSNWSSELFCLAQCTWRSTKSKMI